MKIPVLSPHWLDSIMIALLKLIATVANSEFCSPSTECTKSSWRVLLPRLFRPPLQPTPPTTVPPSYSNTFPLVRVSTCYSTPAGCEVCKTGSSVLAGLSWCEGGLKGSVGSWFSTKDKCEGLPNSLDWDCVGDICVLCAYAGERRRQTSELRRIY
jgi:hypothetical protein